jgi:hypothetical protein
MVGVVRVAMAAGLLAGAAGAVRAQGEAAAHAPSGGGRVLGGHAYVPLSTVPQPFVSTFFAMGVGGAAALDVTEAVIVDIGGVPDTLVSAGDLVFGAVDFTFQQRLGSRFAVRGSLSATARGGTNARLIFAEGLSGLTTVSLGGLMTLRRGERQMLTATLDVRRGNLTEVTLDEFADYVGEWGIDSIEHWGEHLTADRKNSRIVGGLRGAWTLRPWLGVSGIVEAGPTNLYESGSKLATTLGLGASLDLRPLRGHVPLGVGFGFGRLRPPARADDIFGLATTFNWAVTYNGRSDLAIGLDVQHSKSKLVDSSETVLTSSFRLAIRYDF